ncbi:hypothetical protein IJM86_08790 [bacterium]|nr:hypothetical protein [bacterium]
MYQFSHIKNFKDIMLKNIRKNKKNAYEIRIPFYNGEWIEINKEFLKQKENEEIKIIKSR